MTPLISLDAAEQEVLAEARKLLATVRLHAANDPKTVPDAVAVLSALRKDIYEDLNQIQHEYFIIKGARWLLGTSVVAPEVSWQWNPRQTGTAAEPDLGGDLNGDRVVSAEVTTSTDPRGKIDKRMASTLAKLNAMPGRKFYFVCAEAMRQRAETKIEKSAWDIQVVCLTDSRNAF